MSRVRLSPRMRSPRGKLDFGSPWLEALESRQLLARVGAEVSPGASADLAAQEALLATNTTIVASANPVSGNDGVTYTVTVSGPPGSTIPPVGYVKISVNGFTNQNYLGGFLEPTAPDSGTSVATVSVAPFTADGRTQIDQPYFVGPGTSQVVVSFPGDQNYLASASSPLDQVVEQASTTTFAGLLPSTVAPGQPITLLATARVLGTSGLSLGPPVRGSITFFDGATAVGTVPVIPNPPDKFSAGLSGSASLTIPGLDAGPHSFTAVYSGDANYLGSGSAPAVPTLISPSMAGLTISWPTMALGQPVSAFATVYGTPEGPTPTGLVTFSFLNLAFGVDSPAYLTGINSEGQASFTFLPTTPGPYLVRYSYSGDANYQPSNASASVSVLVPVSVSLVSDKNLATPGEAVTFTAFVTPPPSINPLGGTVSFIDTTGFLGEVPLDANNQAKLTTTLGAGPHSVTALYGGNAFFNSSISPVAVPVTVVSGLTPNPVAPAITGLQRQGIHNQPTTLVLAFRGPLDQGRAQDVGNYTLTGPSGLHPIPIATAVYDADANTVTLTTARRLNLHPAFRYRLTVNGTAPRGLASPEGLALDGAGDGQPGTSYTALFSGYVRPAIVPVTRARPGLRQHPAGPRHAPLARR